MTNVLQPAGEGKRKGNILVRSSCLHLLARGRSGGDECRAFSPSTFCGWNRWRIAGIFFSRRLPNFGDNGTSFHGFSLGDSTTSCSPSPNLAFCCCCQTKLPPLHFSSRLGPPSVCLPHGRPSSLTRPFRPSAVRSRKERKKETLPGKKLAPSFFANPPPQGAS